MEELYFRVAVIQKEESILVILEESNKSHLIVNRLKDITITACTSVEPHRLASNNSRNVVESGSEEVIMKLIRAGEEAEIGLTSWSNQLIEL
jgi:bifunctional DNA-binding transcriptional regulator/antitoxin component of YhaV-PrlF toxin-antitoxin module